MPAFSNDNQSDPEKNEAVEEKNEEHQVQENQAGEEQRSKFLIAGKYFLLLVLVFSLGGSAYFLVDKYYEEIYELTVGRSSDDTVTYVINEIIANPAGTNASRFLVVEIGLVLASSSDAELVDGNIMQIKDRINEVLSTKPVDELVRPEGRSELRVELAEEINQAIGVRSVRNLYFIRYVIQ